MYLPYGDSKYNNQPPPGSLFSRSERALPTGSFTRPPQGPVPCFQLEMAFFQGYEVILQPQQKGWGKAVDKGPYCHLTQQFIILETPGLILYKDKNDFPFSEMPAKS